MQRILGSNFSLGGNIVNPQGVGSTPYNDYGVIDLTYIGTPDVVLQPALTCDPRSNVNHSAHQYFNVNCFALPSYGINGPAELPYIHGPFYFDLDSRLSKGFRVGEKKDVQLQLSGFNVINYANHSFSSKFPGEQTLTFNGTYGQPVHEANPTQFGFANYRFGRRVVEISLKYNF